MEENKKKSFIREWGPFILIIIIILIVKFFIITPIKVNGDSMNPTLKDGDIMILNRIDYKLNGLNRFDIVVLKKDGEYLIKRVIGLPGEEIKYKNNKLYINGKYIKENYTRKVSVDIDEVIPEGKYYVLGDNRLNSLDSEEFGPVSGSKILGKTKLTLFPFKHFGNKK